MTAIAKAPAPLAVTAAAVLTPWGDAAAGLPGTADLTLPKVRGFGGSRFSPLIHNVAARCLGAPGPTEARGGDERGARRTGIVLATLFGDTANIDTSIQRVMDGQVHNPLLFFQSVTTSVLGHLTKEYGITGPLVCVSGAACLASEALAVARLSLAADDVDQVLLIAVECAPNERAAWVHEALAAPAQDGLDALPAGDVAVALLLRLALDGDGMSGFCDEPGPRTALPRPWPEAFGWLTPLVAAAELHRRGENP